MVQRRFRAGGVPILTSEEIEAEIEKLQAETTHTETWMSRRASARMCELEAKDRKLRHAFEAGYRMGSDSSFLAPIAGIGIAGLLVGAAVFFRDVILPMF